MEHDGFNEKKEMIAESLIKKDQEKIQQRMMQQKYGTEYMENQYDLHKYTTDPGLDITHPKIKEITKLWTLGNFNNKDEKILLMLNGMMNDLDYLLPETNTKTRTAFVRDMMARISISRGRNGRAAELLVSQIGATKTEIIGLNDKKKHSIFGLKRR